METCKNDKYCPNPRRDEYQQTEDGYGYIRESELFGIKPWNTTYKHGGIEVEFIISKRFYRRIDLDDGKWSLIESDSKLEWSYCKQSCPDPEYYI